MSVFRWRLADLDAMKQYLSTVDWQSIVYCNSSARDMWQAFLDVIYVAVDLFVPRSRPNRHRVAQNRKHYPRSLQNLCHKKMQTVENVQKQSTRPSPLSPISGMC